MTPSTRPKLKQWRLPFPTAPPSSFRTQLVFEPATPSPYYPKVPCPQRTFFPLRKNTFLFLKHFSRLPSIPSPAFNSEGHVLFWHANFWIIVHDRCELHYCSYSDIDNVFSRQEFPSLHLHYLLLQWDLQINVNCFIFVDFAKTLPT